MTFIKPQLNFAGSYPQKQSPQQRGVAYPVQQNSPLHRGDQVTLQQSAPNFAGREGDAPANFVKVHSMDEFDEAVLQAKGPVVMYAGATWCPPCQTFGPQFDKMAEVYPDIQFVKADVDEIPELHQEYGIMSIPFVMIFNDGETERVKHHELRNKLKTDFGS